MSKQQILIVLGVVSVLAIGCSKSEEPTGGNSVASDLAAAQKDAPAESGSKKSSMLKVDDSKAKESDKGNEAPKTGK